MTPADNHRLTAAEFTTTVRGVADDQWDADAPPDGWLARDVIRHLAWFGDFLRNTTSIELPAMGSVDDDPVAAWETLRDAVQALLDDPERADGEHDFGPMGTGRLADIVDRIYTSDLFVHRWDLARSTGQDDTLDPSRCTAMLEGMRPVDAMLRASGHYGPKLDVPEDADPQTALLAFLGRSARWPAALDTPTDD